MDKLTVISLVVGVVSFGQGAAVGTMADPAPLYEVRTEVIHSAEVDACELHPGFAELAGMECKP